MLCFVAGFAKALEAYQVLTACLFIEPPSFVAVHPALATTNPTVITGPAIDVAANTIPLATRQQIGKAGTS